MWYKDRHDAGQQLARALEGYKDGGTVVLALPRGGIVLGAEIAKYLGVELGVVLVRKIGHPQNPEFAIGAVAEDRPPIYSEDVSQIDKSWLSKAESGARQLNQRRGDFYYGQDQKRPEIYGKLVILVDDGIATGLTMQAAIEAVRSKRAKKVVVAAPLASVESVRDLEGLADAFILLGDPAEFLGSVGAHYSHFEQVTDEQVRDILQENNLSGGKSK